MKYILLLTAVFLCCYSSYCQPDTTIKDSKKKEFFTLQRLPNYPGGIGEFNKMIKNHLKYPELAELIGVNGRVNVGFVIDTSGHITNITPLNCIGAGCESEAVNVLSMSKPWQPGMQDNKLVRVQYTVPITFRANKPRVSFKELRRSKYGFVFEISGNNYNIDQAEQMLGKTFNSSQIEIETPYTVTDKFLELEGKDVYLIKVKSI